MLPDSYDPADARTCSTCGRNDFQPTAEVLAETQKKGRRSSEGHIHGHRAIFEGRGRTPGIATGVIAPAIRRIA